MTMTAEPTTEAGSRVAAVRPSMARLTSTELRKLTDTRAGRWLLATIGLIAVGIAVAQLFVLDDADQTFTGFFVPSLVPAALLLPVVGILSITSEWTQRTALTTYALVPHRERVVLAKLAAVVLAALASVLVSLAVAAVGALAAKATGGAGSWDGEWVLVPHAAVSQLVWGLMGAAFGLLLLNTPLAIVGYLLLPTVWGILTTMISALQGPANWLDPSITMDPLNGSEMTAGQWGRLAVTVLVWVAVPLVAGLLRTLRREVS